MILFNPWPFAPVLLLGLCVTIQTALVTSSSRQPGLAVEPHYYEAGLAWDERQAEERRVAALGWQVEVEVARGDVLVRLLDAAGAPLDGATVEVRALHPARPDRPRAGGLPWRAPGLYGAAVAFDRPGDWELQVDVRRAGERTRRTVRREVSLAPERP